MKRFPIIVDYESVPGSNKMIYTDDTGTTYIGPSKIVYLNKSMPIEAGEELEDGHIPIIKFL